MDEVVVYWAAPCFTQAERVWNRLCAKNLRKRRHKVILPQDEAKKFIIPGRKPDFEGLARHCCFQAIASDVMVAILDGSDPDSGMSLEAGLKVRDEGIVIGVRTDFRVAEDGQLNAMFRLLTRIIYFPSFNESHEELCEQIDRAIRDLFKANAEQ